MFDSLVSHGNVATTTILRYPRGGGGGRTATPVDKIRPHEGSAARFRVDVDADDDVEEWFTL